MIGPVEDQMGGVKVQSVQGHLGLAQDVVGDGREDGMALVEEGVEGASESVVVELVGGNLKEEFGPSFLGPVCDVDECGGFGEASGHEEPEYLSVGEFLLGIGRQMAIDHAHKVELLEQRMQQRKRSEIPKFGIETRPKPGDWHVRSAVGSDPRKSRTKVRDRRCISIIRSESRAEKKKREK